MDHDDRTLHEPTLVPPTGSTPRERMEAVLYELRRVVVGQDRLLDRVLVALLSRGHVLLEGVPGLAKTLTLETVARVCGGHFSRIQFTPDLVPSDVVGGQVLDRQGDFSTRLGPVFANFVLADEINRAPAKVQSALLEVMAERQVSLGGKTYPLPKPFIVLATQNPIESEGVYPLPEAQRDRFLMKIDVRYPGAHEELQILQRMSVDPPEATEVLDTDQLTTLQRAAEEVSVHELVADYIVRLVMATREPEQYRLPDLRKVIEIGASPRATLGLVSAARALALLNGRDYVLPDDVRAVARDVMSHRLVLTFDAVADGVDTGEVIAQILAAVPPPRVVWNQGVAVAR
jgi:MoxR-like ATPase